MDELKSAVQKLPGVNQLFKSTGSALILRGVLFLVLGLLLLFNPVKMILIVTISLGVFIFCDGLFVLAEGLRCRDARRTRLLVTAAILLVLGALSGLAPFKMDMFWVVLLGIWELFSAAQCFALSGRDGVSILSGVLSLVIGLLLVTSPFSGLLAVLWLLAVLVLIAGGTALALGIRMRRQS